MMHIAVQSTPRHEKADVDRDEEKKNIPGQRAWAVPIFQTFACNNSWPWNQSWMFMLGLILYEFIQAGTAFAPPLHLPKHTHTHSCHLSQCFPSCIIAQKHKQVQCTFAHTHTRARTSRCTLVSLYTQRKKKKIPLACRFFRLIHREVKGLVGRGRGSEWWMSVTWPV